MGEDKDIKASKLRLGEQAALMLNIEDILQNDPGNGIRKDAVYNNFAVYRLTGSEKGSIKDDAAGGHISLTKRLFRNIQSISYSTTFRSAVYAT